MKRSHRSKELTEVQTLKKINKSLRDENRNLKKEIRRLEKREHHFEEITYSELDEQLNEPAILKCPSCGKGNLEEVMVVGRYFQRCSVCDYRSKTIIVK